jgi:hypothetical protein
MLLAALTSALDAPALFNFIDADGDSVITSAEMTEALLTAEPSFAESQEFLPLYVPRYQ